MRRLTILAAFAALTTLTACGPGEALVSDVDAEGDATSLDAALSRPGRFETFVGADGQHYFHLLAGNGEKVLASEGYASKQAALEGIRAVQLNGVSEARYLAREAQDGSQYFLLTAGNGAIIAVSELYASAAAAARGQAAVRGVLTKALAEDSAQLGQRFESFKGLDGKQYFHLRAANGAIVLQSQGYTTRSAANDGVASVKVNGVNAERYEVRAAADGKFYFVLKGANGRVIARGETYETKANAERAVQAVVGVLTDKSLR